VRDAAESAKEPLVRPKRRRDRASYLEQLSARLLRNAERALKDRPETAAQVSSLVGELLVELRRAETACRDLEERLEALSVRHHDLLDRVPVPCLLTDEQGLVTNVNREALLLLRASERHMLGRPVALWFKERRLADGFIRELRSDRRPINRQLEITPRDRRSSTATVIVQQVDGVEPALWRWFLLRDAGT
jgi:PAS domain-containing protein